MRCKRRLGWTLVLAGMVVLAQEPADLILTGGPVITMDENLPRARAVAVKNGRILAVGSESDINRHKNDTTRIIELAGNAVIPGFIEGHGHLSSIGEAKMNLDLMKVRNWDEVIDMVAQAAREKEKGDWIIGRGWHQEKWNKTPDPHVTGYPLHHGLSAVSPDHPVLLVHASGHALFANAKAMALAGVTAETSAPTGGAIIRDEDGNPIGVFEETAEGLINRVYGAYLAKLNPEQKRQRARRAVALAVEECLAKGVTSFHDAGSGFSQIALYRELAEKGELGLRLWVMINASNETIRRNLPKAKVKNHGDNMFTVGGIKKYVDGALGSRGAWLLKPYADLPGSVGQQVTTLEELKETAKIALEHELQLCTHAIGDRGNREMLDLYAGFTQGKDLRWRVEHAQHLHPEDIPRFAELGVIASMQGVHCTSDAPFVVKRLGHQRAREGAYAWRALMEAGAVVTNGTDAPVEDVSPIECFYATVTRKPKRGGDAFFPQHKLTAMDALKTYTINNAYAVFEEDIKGSITPGKLADFAILSADITSVDPGKILNTQVLHTILGGKVVYSR